VLHAQDSPYERYEAIFEHTDTAQQVDQLAVLLKEHADFYPAYLSLTGIFIEQGKDAAELERFVAERIGRHPFTLPVLMGIFNRDKGNRKEAEQWFRQATDIPASPFLVSLCLRMVPDRADDILRESGLGTDLGAILKTLYVDRKPTTQCEEQIRKRFESLPEVEDPQLIMLDTYNNLLLLMEKDVPLQQVLDVWNRSRAKQITEQHPMFKPISGQLLFRLHMELLDRESSRSVIRESLVLARKYHYTRPTFLFSQWSADLESKEGRIPEAISILKNELPNVRVSGNTEDLIQTLSLLGRLYESSGLSEEAIPPLQEALSLAERTNPRRMPHLKSTLARSYLSVGDLERAEPLAREALELATKNEQETYRTSALRLLAQIMFSEGNMEEGIDLATQLLRHAEEMKNPAEIALASSTVASGFIRMDEPCKAIPHIQRTFDLALDARSSFWNHYQMYRILKNETCPGTSPWPISVFHRVSMIRTAVRESDKVDVNAFDSLQERYEFLADTVQAHRYHAEAMGDVARTVAILAGSVLGLWALFFGIYSLFQWRNKNLIGPYLVKELVGEGGMGDVYRAVSMENRQTVALKILKIPVTGSPHKIRRFKDEIKILSRLDHPNVLQYYDSGEHRGRLYLATEFLEGETLESKLEREWPLPMELALFITGEILEGLEYLHGKGVLHRDIKPANIMVAMVKFSLTHPTSRMGRMVKLMDFGIAKEIGTDSQTQGLEVVGTPAYCAGIIDHERVIGANGYLQPGSHPVPVVHRCSPVPAPGPHRGPAPDIESGGAAAKAQSCGPGFSGKSGDLHFELPGQVTERTIQDH